MWRFESRRSRSNPCKSAYCVVCCDASFITGFSESAVGVSLAFAALAAVATSRCVVGWVGTVDDEPTLA
jgi:hypothetical protein